MNDQSKTSRRSIFGTSRNVTFSPASVSGPTRSALLELATTVQFGQVLAPANLSPRQARAAGLLTSGTYGLPGSGSSASAVLTASTASRLTALLADSGSTLFQLTWKEAVTPSGRRYSLLRASARPTKGIDATSWVSPTAQDHSRGDKEARSWDTGVPLSQQVIQASWPTPMAGSPATETYNMAGNSDYSRRVVELSAWPSPTKGNGDGGQSMANASPTGQTEDGRKITVSLPGVADLSGWPTTTRRDWKDGGEQPNVPLNALLGRVAWLSGWPPPRAEDAGCLGERKSRGVTDTLTAVSRLTSDGPARLTVSGKILTGSSAETASGGQLSPELSRRLQGLPSIWDRAAPTKADLARRCSPGMVTPSARSKPPPSSMPHSERRRIM